MHCKLVFIQVLVANIAFYCNVNVLLYCSLFPSQCLSLFFSPRRNVIKYVCSLSLSSILNAKLNWYSWNRNVSIGFTITVFLFSSSASFYAHVKSFYTQVNIFFSLFILWILIYKIWIALWETTISFPISPFPRHTAVNFLRRLSKIFTAPTTTYFESLRRDFL